ncbi:F-box protein [Raphanus sativus]|nr:F-box protein [Raphanus sativus]
MFNGSLLGVRLKTPLEKPEAQQPSMSEAELKSFRAILESKSGSSSAVEEKEKNQISNQYFFLPDDLVRLILPCLALKDNIRSSLVCKTWSEIAASVLRHIDKPYWLMYLITCNTTRGVSYGFYDPIAKKKTKAMTLPELSINSKIFCSNEGWLLIKDYSPHGNLCFFNPFTRKRINLHFSKHTICSTTFAFTCAPTKIGCLVVGIEGFPDSVYTTISTWHPGAVTWVHEKFPNEISSHFRHTKNIIYSDGLFYMATEIALGVFDPSARTWNVLPMQPILGVGPRIRTLRWMTEYAGQIYLVDASYVDPVVFRLNRLESVWEKKETLDGCSIFVSNGLCVITSSLTGSMSNILYIWNNDINGRRPTKYMCTFKRNRPYKYSLYNKSLCEDPEGYYFEYLTRRDMDGVWIEPPQDISIYDFSTIDPSDAMNTRLFFLIFQLDLSSKI